MSMKCHYYLAESSRCFRLYSFKKRQVSNVSGSNCFVKQCKYECADETLKSSMHNFLSFVCTISFLAIICFIYWFHSLHSQTIHFRSLFYAKIARYFHKNSIDIVTRKIYKNISDLILSSDNRS